MNDQHTLNVQPRACGLNKKKMCQGDSVGVGCNERDCELGRLVLLESKDYCDIVMSTSSGRGVKDAGEQ